MGLRVFPPFLKIQLKLLCIIPSKPKRRKRGKKGGEGKGKRTCKNEGNQCIKLQKSVAFLAGNGSIITLEYSNCELKIQKTSKIMKFRSEFEQEQGGFWFDE